VCVRVHVCEGGCIVCVCVCACVCVCVCVCVCACVVFARVVFACMHVCACACMCRRVCVCVGGVGDSRLFSEMLASLENFTGLF